VLLVRTMKQQNVRPMAIYSGWAQRPRRFKFVKEFPDVADGVIDCNHWYNPKDKRAIALRRKVKLNQFYTYEVYSTTSRSTPARRRHPSAPGRRNARRSSTHWRPPPGTSTSCPTDLRASSTARIRARRRWCCKSCKGDIRVVLPNTYAESELVLPLEGPEASAPRSLFERDRCKPLIAVLTVEFSFRPCSTGLTTGPAFTR